jgi:tRNA-specific 2-thiouridylase
MRDTFKVGACHWIEDAPASEQLLVKMRHGPAFHDARVHRNDAGIYTVHLATRDQGIAPGQYAVFYDETRCLGGGVIL